MKALTDEFDSYDFDEIVNALVDDGYKEDDVNRLIENGFEGSDDNELEFEAKFVHPMCGYNNSWQTNRVKANLRKLSDGSYQLKATVEVGAGTLPPKYAYDLENGYMDCEDAIKDVIIHDRGALTTKDVQSARKERQVIQKI